RDDRLGRHERKDPRGPEALHPEADVAKTADHAGDIGDLTEGVSGTVAIEEGMVEIEPLRVQIGREEDGRFLASVPDLPGVMAHGETEGAAVRKFKSIARQILADMIESGEEVPEPLKALFAA